jgi:hypothetical protein
MKKQQRVSKFAAFAKEAIDQKQMIRVQGGQWKFWNWLGGGGLGGGGGQQA